MCLIYPTLDNPRPPTISFPSQVRSSPREVHEKNKNPETLSRHGTWFTNIPKCEPSTPMKFGDHENQSSKDVREKKEENGKARKVKTRVSRALS
jgi:hypothetical protein